MVEIMKHQALPPRTTKGFTIVELVLVLAVLSTLVALSVPAITGYIESTRTQKSILEAQTAHAALETIVNDAYLHNGNYLGAGEQATLTNVLNMPQGEAGTVALTGPEGISSHITRLCGAGGSYTLLAWDASGGRLNTFVVTVPSGVTIEYNGTDYLVVS